MKKNILILLSVMTMSMATTHVQAQNYISNQRSAERDQIDDNPNDMGLVLFAKSQDLVVTVPNGTVPVTYNCRTKTPDGYFEYAVSVGTTQACKLRFQVAKRGDVHSTSFVASLERTDVNYAYLIDEVELPIYTEELSDGNNVILDEKLAAVEFTVSGYKLQLDYDQELQASVQERKRQGDSQTTITTVTFPIKVLNKAREKVNAAMAEADRLQAADKSDWDEDQYDAFENAKDAVIEANEQLGKLGTITVWLEGSNKVSVSVADFKPREKETIAVLPVAMPTGDNWKQFVIEAGNQYRMRNYRAAREQYLSALRSDDCDPDFKSTLQSQVADCDTCIVCDSQYRAAADHLQQLRKDGNIITQEQAANYYISIIGWLEELNRRNHCDYYDKGIATIQDALKDLPLQIRFAVNKWDLGDGEPFAGVEIWGYYGTEGLVDLDRLNDRQFNNLRLKNIEKYRLLGTTDPDGQCTVEFDRQELPQIVFLRPSDEEQRARIEYISMDRLLSKATGAYDKKQFRTRLSVRTK